MPRGITPRVWRPAPKLQVTTPGKSLQTGPVSGYFYVVFIKIGRTTISIGQPPEEKGVIMDVNLVQEGLKFMVLGMGIVFLFLILMIVAMNVMSKVVHRLFPEPEGAAVTTTSVTPAGMVSADDKMKKVAAIAAALHHHNTK